MSPPNYPSYVGTIIESGYRLGRTPNDKLIVKIISFDENSTTFKLEILATGEWQSSLGLTKGRILETTHHFSNSPESRREWWNLESGLPWISLALQPEPSFEHYR